MKKLLFIACTTFTAAHAQTEWKGDKITATSTVRINKFQLTSTGFDTIVNSPGEAYPIDLIYKRTKEWIQYNFKSPNDVLKADLNGNYLRLNGYDSHGYTRSSLGLPYTYPISFVMEVEIKDGRYRLTLDITDVWYEGKSAGFPLQNYFKEDGSVRKMYIGTVEQLTAKANELNLSLYKYITGETIAKKNDW